jgi:hypothetical protein
METRLSGLGCRSRRTPENTLRTRLAEHSEIFTNSGWRGHYEIRNGGGAAALKKPEVRDAILAIIPGYLEEYSKTIRHLFIRRPYTRDEQLRPDESRIRELEAAFHRVAEMQKD